MALRSPIGKPQISGLSYSCGTNVIFCMIHLNLDVSLLIMLSCNGDLLRGYSKLHKVKGSSTHATEGAVQPLCYTLQECILSFTSQMRIRGNARRGLHTTRQDHEPLLRCVSIFVADVDSAPELRVRDEAMQSPPEAGTLRTPERYEICFNLTRH